MVPIAEACTECTQNCLMIHRTDRNPSPVTTTFFKVMFGDNYSKVLFLPPRFAQSVQNMVGKETQLEDLSGEKWKVKFTMVGNLLAFEEGWNTFSLDHGLKMGDFLVFHYIMESHFVVLMYGQSGCPEIRHFGFTRHQMKETRKKRKLIADDHGPSNVNTNAHHRSYESSSQSERSVHEANERLEIRHSVGTQHKKKRTDVMMPPNGNTTSTHHHLLASSSRPRPSVLDKENFQRSEPLVRNTNLDNMVSEAPTTVKQFCLIDSNTRNVEDGYGRNCLHDLSIPEINLEESNGSRKNNVAVRGGGDETHINKSIKKVSETRFEESKQKVKKSTMMPSEVTCDTSIKKRLRSANLSIIKTENSKKELVGTSDKDDVVKGFHVTQANMPKKESLWASKTDASGSRLYDVCIPPASGIFVQPKAKLMEVTKKELTMNRGSDGAMGTFSGCEFKDTKTGCHNSPTKENDDILPTVKPEPVDYDEAPPPGATNTSFSAVMSSYQYLELPEWVKLKSKVVLLRNGAHLWPVLYQNKVGLKALTQSWEVFARERGIEPGDKCEFVLESEPDDRFTCSMFSVHVTRK